MVNLVEDNLAVWTSDICDKYEKHEDAFPSFHHEKKEIHRKLKAGHKIPRANKAFGERYFKIMNNDKMVGELRIFHWSEDDCDEVSIFVFDEYQRKKFGSIALQQYISAFHTTRHCLVASVSETNRLKSKIIKMLDKIGFEYDERREYYVYKGEV